MQTQYNVLGYRVALYFHDYKLAMVFDENGQSDRSIDYEIKTQKAIEQELSQDFIRIDPDKIAFHIFNPISTSLFGSAVSLRGGGVGGLVELPPPLVFSRSTCPINFKLGKYLTHHKYFQNKSKWYPRSRDFFNDVIIFREI